MGGMERMKNSEKILEFVDELTYNYIYLESVLVTRNQWALLEDNLLKIGASFLL